jgi:hypothetical protein
LRAGQAVRWASAGTFFDSSCSAPFGASFWPVASGGGFFYGSRNGSHRGSPRPPRRRSRGAPVQSCGWPSDHAPDPLLRARASNSDPKISAAPSCRSERPSPLPPPHSLPSAGAARQVCQAATEWRNGLRSRERGVFRRLWVRRSLHGSLGCRWRRSSRDGLASACSLAWCGWWGGLCRARVRSRAEGGPRGGVG